jgi:hypothetical protein
LEWFNLMLALALPSLLGAVGCALLINPTIPGRMPLVMGNGVLLGLVLTPLLMRLLAMVGLPLGFPSTSPLMVALILALGAFLYRRHHASYACDEPRSPELDTLQRVLCLLFLLLVVTRLVTLGMELIWRPLYPFDATMHWATKSRVWFDAQAIVPFVENQQWLDTGGEGVFTDHHPGYPITIPLLQVWINSAIGRWDASLMNLPWLLCLTGIAAAFYGQARAVGSSPLTASVFTYLLVSLPLLNTHVALAGYADIFLGACYCAAIMAFHSWSLTRNRGQAALAVIFALCGPLIKNEGFFWLLTFLPALVVVLLSWRHASAVLGAVLVALVAILVFLPQDLVIAGHSLGELSLRFRPGALAGTANSLWAQDNWHLLGYMLISLLLLAIFSGRSAAQSYAGTGVALLSGTVLFLVLFLFTKYSLGAVRYTAVGRISLHLIPSLMFLCLLLWNEVSVRPLFGYIAGSRDEDQARRAQR